jgi:hypothetical protein
MLGVSDRSRAVPRFFFHLCRNRRRFVDEDGQEFGNADQAWEAAKAAALDLMDSEPDGRGSWLESTFEVTDEAGEIVFEFAFLEAAEMPSGPN